jgi:hypothetical protein
MLCLLPVGRPRHVASVPVQRPQYQQRPQIDQIGPAKRSLGTHLCSNTEGNVDLLSSNEQVGGKAWQFPQPWQAGHCGRTMGAAPGPESEPSFLEALPKRPNCHSLCRFLLPYVEFALVNGEQMEVHQGQ